MQNRSIKISLKKTVLIVEDNPVIAEILSNILQREGFKCCSIQSARKLAGFDAYVAKVRFDYDLVARVRTTLTAKNRSKLKF